VLQKQTVDFIHKDSTLFSQYTLYNNYGDRNKMYNLLALHLMQLQYFLYPTSNNYASKRFTGGSILWVM